MRTKIQQTFLRVWTVALFGMLSIIPLVFGVMYAKDTVALHVNGERIEGEVTQSRPGYREHRRYHGPRYTVAYDTNRDDDIEEVEFAAPFMMLVQEFEVGERVTVIQDPIDVKNAEIDRGTTTWVWRYGIAGIAIAVGVIAAMFFGFLVKTGKLK